jgi:hypothetical protein
MPGLGQNSSPWQFRKIDGVWHRRPVNTNKPWHQLTVKREIGPKFPNRSRIKPTSRQTEPSVNVWTWK